MIKLYTVLILLLVITGKLSAQTGELQGKITDAKNNEGIPFAPIVLQVKLMTTGTIIILKLIMYKQ